MIRGFHSAGLGMLGHQNYLNNIANNIANINTTAFKPQQTEFASLLYENINGGSGTMNSTGHGSKVEQSGTDFTQGTLEKTDAPLDCAIDGEGFFAVQTPNSDIKYTRDGAFHKSVEGDRQYLVNSHGNYVLGTDGNRLDITQGFDSKNLGVFTFSNPYGLQPSGGNLYSATDQSGQGTVYEEGSIRTGYLESSATDLSKEMVKMIEASRGFSFNAKMLQATDEMEKTINQLR